MNVTLRSAQGHILATQDHNYLYDGRGGRIAPISVSPCKRSLREVVALWEHCAPGAVVQVTLYPEPWAEVLDESTLRLFKPQEGVFAFNPVDTTTALELVREGYSFN